MGVRARNSNEKMVKLTTIEPKKMTVVATRKRVSTHTRNEINSDQHISSTIGFSEYTANGMIKDVSTDRCLLSSTLYKLLFLGRVYAIGPIIVRNDERYSIK